MKALKFFIFLSVVAFSLTAPFWISHRMQLQLREVENSLKEQAGEITRLSAVDHAAPGMATPPASNDQLREVLRLRDEVGRLRDAVAETKKLRELPRTAAPSLPAEIPTGPNYWPADQMVNAGFATPESALKTWLWALKSGDVNSILSCLVPEFRAEMEQETQKHGGGTAEIEEAFKAEAAETFSGKSGFRLVDEKTDSSGAVTELLSFEGEGVAEEFHLKQTPDGWKILESSQPEIYEPGRRL